MTAARDSSPIGRVDPRAQRTRSRLGVLLLALLFFAPLLLAALLYYGHWRPPGSTNHGTLIEPVRPLADPLFHGKWSLVYIGSGDCAAECQHALYYMRQTHLGLGRLAARVQRLLLMDRGCCAARPQLERNYAGLITRDVGNGQAPGWLAAFPLDDRNDTIFIVDPLGNLMMRYDVRAPPKGLLADLKQLLQLSSIG